MLVFPRPSRIVPEIPLNLLILTPSIKGDSSRVYGLRWKNGVDNNTKGALGVECEVL